MMIRTTCLVSLLTVLVARALSPRPPTTRSSPDTPRPSSSAEFSLTAPSLRVHNGVDHAHRRGSRDRRPRTYRRAARTDPRP